jgi:hypothetical protein
VSGYSANATISPSVLGNLAVLQFLSIKSYIPFSPQVCGGLVLYFSFTSLSIVLGLFLQPLHSGLFSSFSVAISTAINGWR